MSIIPVFTINHLKYNQLQNKYVGDIGDFGKLLLLKALSENLQLGVNWCLAVVSEQNNDGAHTTYLFRESKLYKEADLQLFNILK